jgi:hypothetical protein
MARNGVPVRKLDFLLPTTVVLLIALAIAEIFAQFQDPTLRHFVKPDKWVPPNSFGDFKARTQWLVVSIASLSSGVAVSGMFCTRVIYRCIAERQSDLRMGASSLAEVFPLLIKQSIRRTGLIIMSYVVIASTFMYIIVHQFASGDSYFVEYVEAMFRNVNISGWDGVHVADIVRRSFFWMEGTIAVMTILVVLAITATSAGWSRLLPDLATQLDIDKFNGTPSADHTASKYDQEIYSQAEHLDYLRRVIYAGSAAQTLGVIAFSAFFNWANSGITDPLTRPSADLLAQAFVLRFAGLSTGLLVAAYVITATILGWRARRLTPYFDGAGRMVPYGQRQITMVGLGIDPQIYQHMAQLLTAVTPVLTGSVSILITGISV